jgi:hypothetical protein
MPPVFCLSKRREAMGLRKLVVVAIYHFTGIRGDSVVLMRRSDDTYIIATDLPVLVLPLNGMTSYDFTATYKEATDDR